MKTSISFSKEELLSRIELQDLRPTIKNKKFSISEVLGLMLSGMSPEEILSNYPELEQEDVLASLYYAMQLADPQNVSNN